MLEVFVEPRFVRFDGIVLPLCDVVFHLGIAILFGNDETETQRAQEAYDALVKGALRWDFIKRASGGMAGGMGVEQEITYTGGLHCEVVHGPSGAALETDAPLDNQGRGEAFSPTDLVASALASCALTTMAIKAPASGIRFGAASGRITKVMSTTSPRRIARLSLDIQMPTGLKPEERRRLEEIGRTCPVALSLADTVVVAFAFRYPD